MSLASFNLLSFLSPYFLESVILALKKKKKGIYQKKDSSYTCSCSQTFILLRSAACLEEISQIVLKGGSEVGTKL